MRQINKLDANFHLNIHDEGTEKIIRATFGGKSNTTMRNSRRQKRNCLPSKKENIYNDTIFLPLPVI